MLGLRYQKDPEKDPNSEKFREVPPVAETYLSEQLCMETSIRNPKVPSTGRYLEPQP